MRIARFSAEDQISYGLLEGDSVKELAGTPFEGLNPTGRTFKTDSIKLLAPCLPSKVVALGLNYRRHAQEMDLEIPANPLIFLKPSTSVIGPGDEIVCPPSSERVDFEGELGVVIGKTARNVSEAEALNYVLGYTCLNDVTARDLQESDGQWTRAKGFDTFCPIGPWIETELDPADTALETWLNGELKQQTSTSDLIYSVVTQIRFISEVMTLLPGDVIATGTPSGIGPMQPGDTVEIKIASIGTLKNYVVKAAG